MTEYRTRDQWGAAPSKGSGNAIGPNPKGTAIHYEGPGMGTAYAHDKCDGIVRGIQRFHQETRGWADIAYTDLTCIHGVVYEGRGESRGSAANGTTQANLDYYASCAIIGEGDTPPKALLDGLTAAVSRHRQHGAGPAVVGHRDLFATACPGEPLYAEVRKGTFGEHRTPPASVSTQAGSAYPHVPAPATHGGPAFPLNPGWYFGPESGPVCSVSGEHGHAADLKVWQKRMADRGWTITVDGEYGDQTAGVARAFQAEKHLHVDGLIGRGTWDAAWSAPVTP